MENVNKLLQKQITSKTLKTYKNENYTCVKGVPEAPAGGPIGGELLWLLPPLPGCEQSGGLKPASQ